MISLPTVSAVLASFYPYYTHDSSSPGILPEVVNAILSTAELSGHNLLLPAKRTILYLEQGKIDFDLVSPSWLNEKHRNDKRFIYSSPILSVDEYVITSTPNNKPIKLDGKKVGTVRGYYYHDDHNFTRVDFSSEKQLIQALARGRVSVAIIGDLPAQHWSEQLNTPIFFNTIHSQGQMHIRLLAKHKPLMPKINHAIETLHKQGQFKAITARYTALASKK